MRFGGGGGTASIDREPGFLDATEAYEQAHADPDTWTLPSDKPRGWTQTDEVPTLADLAP